jgi:hypothetical protein
MFPEDPSPQALRKYLSRVGEFVADSFWLPTLGRYHVVTGYEQLLGEQCYRGIVNPFIIDDLRMKEVTKTVVATAIVVKTSGYGFFKSEQEVARILLSYYLKGEKVVSTSFDGTSNVMSHMRMRDLLENARNC